MRFAWLLAAVLAGSVSQLQAAQQYSREYLQCMNFTYGSQAKTEKCLKKEFKLQKKALKKSYNTYVKLNPNSKQIAKNQYTVFERRLKQQCGTLRAGQLTVMKQRQCQLSMMIDQSNWYQARSFVSTARR